MSKIDQGLRIITKSPNRLVRLIYKFVKSITKSNSKNVWAFDLW